MTTNEQAEIIASAIRYAAVLIGAAILIASF